MPKICKCFTKIADGRFPHIGNAISSKMEIPAKANQAPQNSHVWLNKLQATCKKNVYYRHSDGGWGGGVTGGNLDGPRSLMMGSGASSAVSCDQSTTAFSYLT